MNQYLRLDLVMTVGPVKRAVEVVGTSEVLRTAYASLGEVIEPRLTRGLPVNGGSGHTAAVLRLTNGVASRIILLGCA